MARRSSARLRNRNSSTPKRVSLSHDAGARTPRTAPVKLSTLREDEMPGAFPNSVSPPARESLNDFIQNATIVPLNFSNGTPTHGTPIEPTAEEMHPRNHHKSTAGPLEEARWLGFSSMAPHTEPPKRASKIATLQGTPTKVPNSAKAAESPKFHFTFGREQSLELSPEAKKLMIEKRNEAAKIREQMVATEEGPGDVMDVVQRKIAMPRAKKGRFSDVHAEQFKKMDSIAAHASKFRLDSFKTKGSQAFVQAQYTTTAAQPSTPSPAKSLKRSPSKAELDGQAQKAQQSIARSPSKSSLPHLVSYLSTSSTSKKHSSQVPTEETSPAKRAKKSAGDDVSATRPPSIDNNSAQPATPQPKKMSTLQQSDNDLSKFTSPTQASLARATSIKSVKSCKIPAPLVSHSPTKAAIQDYQYRSPTDKIPLLARSPAKASLFSNPKKESPKNMLSPLLMRTPTKGSPLKRLGSPERDNVEKIKEAPLLSRSPLKMSLIRTLETEVKEDQPSSSIPLLSRSPAKITLPNSDAKSHAEDSPTKSSSSALFGRFNLLRASPIKSILRSPQRLYSNDPAKVAAGTHLASPANSTVNRNGGMSMIKEATPAAEKRVDFTSSTKARYERGQSETSSTPSKGPTPEPKVDPEVGHAHKPVSAEYPTLPSEGTEKPATPQKRRQTAAPYDFTFASHGQGIIFGQSPNAPSSAAKSNRPSTIRHVSAEPQIPLPPPPSAGSKKRKFDFENEKAVGEEIVGVTSDKENASEGEEERPTKRKKSNASESKVEKPAKRLPTLGVKPKKTAKPIKDEKPKSISRARLNALALPKRRG